MYSFALAAKGGSPLGRYSRLTLPLCGSRQLGSNPTVLAPSVNQ